MLGLSLQQDQQMLLVVEQLLVLVVKVVSQVYTYLVEKKVLL
jgi:hypothetical protein